MKTITFESIMSFRAIILKLIICAILSSSLAVEIADPVEVVDHQAHAKPGGPYFAVDWNGDGVDALTIDATQSHTHYFDHGPPPVSGSVVKYEWFSVNSGTKLLESAAPYMSANFFVGVTLLRLVVTDSTGDKADAYTYVTVREPYPGENQIPVVKQISPASGHISGGNVVQVTGTGFYNNPYIYFAGTLIRPDVLSNTKLRFRVPPGKQQKKVPVYVTTGFGTSAQFVYFKYENTGSKPVKFKPGIIKEMNGTALEIPEITTIKVGPDGKYYAGTLNGYIHVLGIDRYLTVYSSCMSENAGNSRSILGLAFHPNEYSPLKLYVATSTLFWRSKQTGADWDNGNVEVWGRNEDHECLSHSYTVINGLPVSANDHAVNALEFDIHGSLYVAIGGTTNAGVHTDGDRIGGIPESPLSGAILRFDMRSPDFDGRIVYTDYRDPGTTTIESGTVEIFASGMRNVFGMSMHSNGKLYAADNGPNNGFGVGATGCNTAGGQQAFKDKLLYVKPKAYYGHPNWNRARFDDRQCVFVRGDEPSNGSTFTAPMAILDSSTNGIIEYTANTFDGKLRGHLILSKLSWTDTGSLKTAKLDKSGTALLEEPLEIYPDSGLSVVMGLFGELLMPKVKQAKIIALVPDEEHDNQLHIFAITPRRGPMLGGNIVLITGNGLDEGTRIYFGEFECTAYMNIAPDGSSLQCEVPAFSSGSRKITVLAKTETLKSKPSGQGEYEYMML